MTIAKFVLACVFIFWLGVAIGVAADNNPEKALFPPLIITILILLWFILKGAGYL